MNVHSVNEEPVGPLRVRNVAARLPQPQSTTWTPGNPTFSAVANALSLLMPALEPFVMKSIRTGAADERVGQDLRARAMTFVLQEGAHQHQHREFNRAITSQVPALRHVEKLQRFIYRSLDRRSTTHSKLAQAAGAEAVAFFTARWVDRRRHALLSDANGPVASMFVWHLAEEVEHKNVAFDVYQAHGGGRTRYLFGIIAALILFAASVVVASAILLVREGHWWKPGVHARMVIWSFSFVFEVFPLLGLCLSKDHHPSKWMNPEWLASWLSAFDGRGGVAPEWSAETLDGIWDLPPSGGTVGDVQRTSFDALAAV